MEITVLGTGRAKYKQAEKVVREAVAEAVVNADVERCCFCMMNLPKSVTFKNRINFEQL